MRLRRRDPVQLRDERPANWNEDDEVRHKTARERWILWTTFWILGSIGTALGAGVQTLGSTLGLGVVAALVSTAFGLWTGPTLPDLVRRNEDPRQNERIAGAVTIVIGLVGTFVWIGALEFLNSALDFSPRQTRSFQVVSRSDGQTRGGSLHRLVVESDGRRFILQGGGARFSGIPIGKTIPLPVGRGLFRVEWFDSALVGAKGAH